MKKSELMNPWNGTADWMLSLWILGVENSRLDAEPLDNTMGTGAADPMKKAGTVNNNDPVAPRPTSTLGPFDLGDNQAVGDESLLQFLTRPGVLAALIGGAVVGLLTAILLVYLVVNRLRKKDEGSYILDESTKPVTASYPYYAYQRAPDKEFYA